MQHSSLRGKYFNACSTQRKLGSPDGLEMSGTFKEVRELVKREFGVLYCDSHLRRILRELEMRCLKPIEQIWRWLKRVLSVKLMKGIEEMKGIIRSHLLILVRRLSFKTRKLFMLLKLTKMV